MNILIVDGGGVKTQAWIADSARKTVLTEGKAGPSNFGRAGEIGLRTVFSELLAALSSHKIDAAVIGLAGVGREPERQKAEAVLKSLLPGIPLRVTTDAHLAYYGAYANGRNGILLIAGTGTIAFYQNPAGHEFFRAGGWGALLGDEGGGAWIGREAMRHCLLEWEKDTLSPLHAAVLETLNIENAPQILTKVYSENFGPSEWAMLTPLVFKFAKDDPGAMAILKAAAVELVALVERLIEDMSQHSADIPLVIMGGIWQQRELLEPLLVNEIALRNLPLIISEPDGGPLDGGFVLFDNLKK
jgi:glucosamine kinase